ncbi:MAG: hypothetical protein WC358_08745 [Ignavibacteria bacterium]|jgi:hypothetical protein
MIGDETVNGKKVFEVDFLDFCNLATRTERRTKFSLNNEPLMEHILKTRYSRKFVISYNGMILDAESIGGKSSDEG